MSKLFRLKKWFTLEDAAKRLAINLGEPVTYQNLIELVIDRQLDLSWFPGPLRVKLVDKVERGTTIVTVGDEVVSEYRDPPEYRENEDPIKTINIGVTLDLDDPGGQLRDWLRVLWSSSGDECDGFRITDPNGFYLHNRWDDETAWRVMEYVGTEADGSASLVKAEDGYYRPRRLPPKRAELVIKRADLEQLETKANKRCPEDKSAHVVLAETGATQLPGKSSDGVTAQSESRPSNRADKVNLRIIGALLDIISKGILEESQSRRVIGPASGFTSEAKLIAALVDSYDYEGISKTTLENRFFAAKEIFKEK